GKRLTGEEKFVPFDAKNCAWTVTLVPSNRGAATASRHRRCAALLLLTEWRMLPSRKPGRRTVAEFRLSVKPPGAPLRANASPSIEGLNRRNTEGWGPSLDVSGRVGCASRPAARASPV